MCVCVRIKDHDCLYNVCPMFPTNEDDGGERVQRMTTACRPPRSTATNLCHDLHIDMFRRYLVSSRPRVTNSLHSSSSSAASSSQQHDIQRLATGCLPLLSSQNPRSSRSLGFETASFTNNTRQLSANTFALYIPHSSQKEVTRLTPHQTFHPEEAARCAEGPPP